MTLLFSVDSVVSTNEDSIAPATDDILHSAVVDEDVDVRVFPDTMLCRIIHALLLVSPRPLNRAE
jgi:hypothetical protein